jgi:hypothetical protein
MLDKIKGTIQNQFDQWFVNIHARGGNNGTGVGYGVGVGTSKNERNNQNERNDRIENDRIINGKNAHDNNIDDNRNNNNNDYRNDMVDSNHYDNDSHSVRSRSSTVNTDRKKTAITENQNMNSTNSKNNLDVESDMLAFYKAREDLLKLRVAK